METLENVCLDSMEGIVMGMRDGMSRGERNLPCFPASLEHPSRNLHETSCAGRGKRELVCPTLPPNHVPGVK